MIENVNIVYWNPKLCNYYYVGNPFCLICEEECVDSVVVKSQWYKRRKGVIDYFCMKCYNKELPKKIIRLPADMSSRFPCLIVSTLEGLPKGSLVKPLVPEGLSVHKGMTVFEAALTHEEGCEIVDNTKLAGRSYVPEIDYDEQMSLVKGRIEELDNSVDGVNYLKNLKKATPIIASSKIKIEESKKGIEQNE